MSNTYLVAVSGKDATGLVSIITSSLFDIGVNLGDTNFTVLGEGAEFTAVCDVPDDFSTAALSKHLQSEAELNNADVRVSPFTHGPTHGENANVTHYVAIQGGDHPGLVAHLSEVFIEFSANIVRLHCEKMSGNGDDIYAIEIWASIPEERAEHCLASISNTATSLQMQCDWMSLVDDM